MKRRTYSFLGFLVLLVIVYLVVDVFLEYLTGTSFTGWLQLLIEGFS